MWDALGSERTQNVTLYTLLAMLFAGTPTVMLIEPFHLVKGTAVLNPVAVVPALNVSDSSGNHHRGGPLLQMPPHLWPSEGTKLSRSERASRHVFWWSFMVSVALCTCVLGTAILVCGFALRQKLASSYQELKERYSFVLRKKSVRAAVCCAAVIAHLSITTKLAVTSSASGTLEPTYGLDYEGYALVLSYGAAWLIIQALAVLCMRPATTSFSPSAFAEAQVAALMPFAADPCDTLKDALFGGIALSVHDWTSKLIGVVSLSYLWLMHFYLLYVPDLRPELEGAYLGVLLLNPRAMANEDQDEARATVSEERIRDASGARGRCAPPMAVLKLLFKQSRPERRLSLLFEDLPQGVLAALFSVTHGFHLPVVVLNIGVPALRYAFAWVSYPRLVRRTDVQCWLAMEWLVAYAAGNVGKAQFYREHLVFGFQASSTAGDVGTVDEAHLWEPLRRLTMTDLNFRSTDLGDVEAKVLAKVLNVNTNLQTLVLGSCHIGDTGAKALAAALKTNSGLQKLYLDRNNIGDAGSEAIASAVKANSTLQYLSIFENESMGDAGIAALAEAHQENGRIEMHWGQ